MDKEKTGLFISKLRKEKELSQEDLANILHVDRSLISKWENGVLFPDIVMLNELSNVFDTPINEIIYGEESNKKNKDEINDNFKNYLKKSNSKYNIFKRLSISLIIVIFVCLFVFLLYYFGSTYNKTKVYKIYGNSEKYNLSDGLLIITKDEGFLKIGDFDSSVYHILIKCKLDDKEVLIYSGKPNNIVVNFYGKNSIINYKNFDDVIDNIYMIVNFDDEIKLSFNNLYSNDFNNYSLSNTSLSDERMENYRVFSLDEVNK